jgi:hypothetical protein
MKTCFWEHVQYQHKDMFAKNMKVYVPYQYKDIFLTNIREHSPYQIKDLFPVPLFLVARH